MPEQESRTAIRHDIRTEGKSLSLLGLAEPGTYATEERSSFRLFGDRKRWIERALEAWCLSLSKEVQLLGVGLLKRLQEWIQVKRETLEHALHDKFSLHFDVLVLGSVSTPVCLYVTLV